MKVAFFTRIEGNTGGDETFLFMSMQALISRLPPDSQVNLILAYDELSEARAQKIKSKWNAILAKHLLNSSVWLNCSTGSAQLSMSVDLNINLSKLEIVLQENLPIGLLQIAHLSATLGILKNVKPHSPDEELQYLKDNGILIEVAAAMPGPCMIYLDAVKKSTLSDAVKLSLINEVMLNTEENTTKFGPLGEIVLQLTMLEWMALVEKSQSLNQNLSDKLTEFRIKIENSDLLNIEKKLTFIDTLILQQLKKFIVEQTELLSSPKVCP